MHRCPVAVWEAWTTKRDLPEDSEWAAAGNSWAAQSHSATERGIDVPRGSAQALTHRLHGLDAVGLEVAFLPPGYVPYGGA